MLRQGLIWIALLLLPALAWTATPTTLRVVELRWIAGQPELETWLGSLQGTLNRRGEEAAVFLVRNDADARWAGYLQRTYGLRREVFTPGALLELARPQLTGQVLYDPAHPWTRAVALTTAAVAPGAVIAADHDLGLPLVRDLRHETDRLAAFRAEIDACAAACDPTLLALAPDGGHLLADLIAARKLLAVDLSPAKPAEAELLRPRLDRLQGARCVIGGADDATPAVLADGLARLTGPENRVTLIPTLGTANLSCFARFPATRPLLQWREEADIAYGTELLVLVYAVSASLDEVNDTLLPLLDDPALRTLPVGIELPPALFDCMPAACQALLAQQNFTTAEFIAAPDGRLPPGAARMDLAAPALAGPDGAWAELPAVLAAAAGPWRGALLHPGAGPLPAWAGTPQPALAAFPVLMASRVIRTVAELRAALAVRGPIQVLVLDPVGVPPSTVQALMKEITYAHSLVTPSQALRAAREYAVVGPYLQAQNVKRPSRRKPTLTVAAPVTSLAKLEAAAPIPLTVRVTGDAPILVARAVFQEPGGRVGTVDLRNDGNGLLRGTLPPMLQGGTVTVRARVVEEGGFGISISPPTTWTIPGIDSDNDTLDDTLEVYLGSDPQRQDSDDDGLPDPLDGRPDVADRDLEAFFPAVTPPGDAAYLTQVGASTLVGRERVVPPGSAVTYRLPLKDVPAAFATLRLLAAGAGTLALNGAAPVPLAAVGSARALTDLPLKGITGPVLTVTVTADAGPVRLASLALITNPDGPYLRALTLTPSAPPANTPIQVRAIVFSPAGVEAVRLRYGASLDTLRTLELTPEKDAGGVVFTGQLPGRTGPRLIYGLVARDRAGRVAAGPYRVLTVGRTPGYTLALLGGRDLFGNWEPDPIWGFGRALTTGTAVDERRNAALRPGAYTAWLLALPRERGLRVTVELPEGLLQRREMLLDATMPAGAPDGWVRLGTFTLADESRRLRLAVAPVGDRGFCAYGELVLTQDPEFAPPLAHAGLDWYNSLAITGVNDGDTITGDAITLTVPVTGNIDSVGVTLELKRGGAVADTRTYPFEGTDPGRYRLSIRGLQPGLYTLKATGYRVTTEKGTRTPKELLSAVIYITIPAR